MFQFMAVTPQTMTSDNFKALVGTPNDKQGSHLVLVFSQVSWNPQGETFCDNSQQSKTMELAMTCLKFQTTQHLKVKV